MDWLWAAVAAWFGWNIVAPFLLLLGVFVVVVLRVTIREWRCDHAHYFENRACHAICSKCHKDLGFIGTWRETLAANKR
jgi:hypothetical protein